MFLPYTGHRTSWASMLPMIYHLPLGLSHISGPMYHVAVFLLGCHLWSTAGIEADTFSLRIPAIDTGTVISLPTQTPWGLLSIFPQTAFQTAVRQSSGLFWSIFSLPLICAVVYYAEPELSMSEERQSLLVWMELLFSLCLAGVEKAGVQSNLEVTAF